MRQIAGTRSRRRDRSCWLPNGTYGPLGGGPHPPPSGVNIRRTSPAHKRSVTLSDKRSARDSSPPGRNQFSHRTGLATGQAPRLRLPSLGDQRDRYVFEHLHIPLDPLAAVRKTTTARPRAQPAAKDSHRERPLHAPHGVFRIRRSLDRAVATPNGWLSEFEIGIRATMDREESKKTSDRMLGVRAAEAQSGKPRVTGQRPFGYNADWSKVDRKEARLIREAVERALTGESLWSITSDWNRRGLPSTNGRQWTVTVLHSILVSGRIAGLREHRGAVVAPATWPAVIDADTHERLKTLLAPKRRHTERAGRRYFLVGLLRCGKCGGPGSSVSGWPGGRPAWRALDFPDPLGPTRRGVARSTFQA